MASSSALCDTASRCQDQEPHPGLMSRLVPPPPSPLSIPAPEAWAPALNRRLPLLFCLSVVSDSFATPQTVPCQAPLSTGFLRQEYWNGLPFPSPVGSHGRQQSRVLGDGLLMWTCLIKPQPGQGLGQNSVLKKWGPTAVSAS